MLPIDAETDATAVLLGEDEEHIEVADLDGPQAHPV
jgi:hypothetical protein